MEEVYIACDGGEKRLDGIQEDRVGEFLGRLGRAIAGCCDALLKEGPGKAGERCYQLWLPDNEQKEHAHKDA